jgi:hypothetical protein
MTMHAPRLNSTAADLMRLLAAWLAAILLVQGLAAGLALGAGPLHRHHGSTTVRAHDEHHHHDGAERHHHRADEGSVVPSAEPTLDAAAFALVAALMLLAFAPWRVASDSRRHVRPVASIPDWRSTAPPPLLRPPRRG